MRTAVSWKSYEQFGCINCGCDFCYTDGGISGGGTSPVKCGECDTRFIVLADGLTTSNIGFGTDKKGVFEYPVLQNHPRKGIPKHNFVRPDIRPENSEGEFCSPRGVGYDLACFVKSKEAGQRIVDMFDKRKRKPSKSPCFVCGNNPAWLDYRPNEPLWIQVKIQYCPSHKKNINALCEMMSEDNIITKDKIKMAIDV